MSTRVIARKRQRAKHVSTGASAKPARRTTPSSTWIALLLAIGTAALFLPACRGGFVNLDDPDYVSLNPRVRSGLSFSGIAWAFTTFHAANWHPLTWLSLQLDASIWGLRPAGYHVTNVLLHSCSAALLFLALTRLTGSPWRSAAVAALFAWHPLRVESVAWISERKDVLSVLFWTLAIIAYARYADAPGWQRMTLVALCMALSLLAKPMAVTLPFVLLLFDYWPLARTADWSGPMSRVAAWRRLVIEKLPLFALSAASAALAVLAQHRGGTMHAGEELPLVIRLEHAVLAAAGYLKQLVWPSGLAVFYPYQRLPGAGLQVAPPALLLAGLSALVYVQRRTRPYLVVGWLWYLGTLVPVIGLVQVGAQAMADRYTYIPSIGLVIAAVWATADFAQALALGGWARLGTAAALLACAGGTIHQLQYWTDSVTLWEHTIAVTPPNAKAEASLGGVFTDQERWGEAVRHYERALAINPRYESVRYNLGTAWLHLGNLDKAVQNLSGYVASHPDVAAARFNLALAFMRQGEWSAAAAHFASCAAIGPESWQGQHGLGLVLAWRGDCAAAIRHYDAAIRANPRFAQAYADRASALGRLEKWKQAVESARRAVELEPREPRFRCVLAMSLHAVGDRASAAAEYGRANRLNPSWFDETRKAAWRLSTQPDPRMRNGAHALLLAQQLRQAQIPPTADVLDTLAAAEAESGRFPEAVADAQQALRLLAMQPDDSEKSAAVKARLLLYQSGQPFRDNPATGAPAR
jgi:tetratricopeptide (TPR) repeat protein